MNRYIYILFAIIIIFITFVENCFDSNDEDTTIIDDDTVSIKWTEITSNANFTGRSGHSCLVYDNKLWVIGGDDGNPQNDVWCGEID